MKTKNRLVLVMLLLQSITQICLAQSFHYGYDLNGNRQYRYMAFFREDKGNDNEMDGAASQEQTASELFEDDLFNELKSEQLQWLIYPNPSSNELYITAEGADAKANKVELITMNGAVLFTNNRPVFPLKIDMQHYASGQYLIRVFDEESFFTRIVIKE